jgi:hypothetical protein
VTFHVGGENYRGSAGAFVSFPRGIAHTFSVESAAARFLVMNTPGGFERMFERAPKRKRRRSAPWPRMESKWWDHIRAKRRPERT